MSYPDYFDDNDRYDDDPKTCERCGAADLHWVHTGVRWALADDKGLHTCAGKPSADDFDVVKP